MAKSETILEKEKELRYGPTVAGTKGSGRITVLKDMANFSIRMGILTKENGNKIMLMALEYLSIRMAKNTKDSGKWTNSTAKGSKPGKTVVSMKDSFGKESRKVTGDIS
jgi:hypothetical protein